MLMLEPACTRSQCASPGDKGIVPMSQSLQLGIAITSSCRVNLGGINIPSFHRRKKKYEGGGKKMHLVGV